MKHVKYATRRTGTEVAIRLRDDLAAAPASADLTRTVDVDARTDRCQAERHRRSASDAAARRTPDMTCNRPDRPRCDRHEAGARRFRTRRKRPCMSPRAADANCVRTGPRRRRTGSRVVRIPGLLGIVGSWLPVRLRCALLAMQGGDARGIVASAFPARHVHTSVAVASACLCDFAEACRRLARIGCGRPIAEDRTRKVERRAHLALARVEALHHVDGELAQPGRLQAFFDRTSCKIALSSERFATSRLSFAFSFSNCLT